MCRGLAARPNCRQESHLHRCSKRHCQLGIPVRQIAARVSTESVLRSHLRFESDHDRWCESQPTGWRLDESSVGRRRRSQMPFAAAFRQSLGSKWELVFLGKTETAAGRRIPSRGRCVHECRLPNERCRFFHEVTVYEDPVMCRPVDFLRAIQKSRLIESDGFLGCRWCKHDNHNPRPGPPRWCRCRAKSVFRRCRSCGVVFSQVSLAGLVFAKCAVGRLVNSVI